MGRTRKARGTSRDDIRALAKRIKLGRSIFEIVYDNVVAQQASGAAQFKTLAKLRHAHNPRLSGRERDVADFAEALAQANDQGWLASFLAPHLESLFEADDKEPVRVALQAIVNINEVFRDPRVINTGSAAAMRRCCRIVCRQPPDQSIKGSGFLIGPNLVLTNWHVVRSKLSKTGETLPDSHAQIDIEFDFLETHNGAPRVKKERPIEKNWLVAWSPAADPELGTLGEGRTVFWPNDKAGLDSLSENLDFAIIELSGTPGYERGWYGVKEFAPPKPDTITTVYQFRLGLTMAVAPGKFHKVDGFEVPAKGARIFHTANTLRGSSGGLCFDFGMNPVALHQGGLEYERQEGKNGWEEMAIKNVAIPLARIAEKAENLIESRILNAPKKVRYTPGRIEPIVGRDAFQSLIDNAMRRECRLITVRNRYDEVKRELFTKVGKTFSTKIMKAMLTAGEHSIVVVKADELWSNAYAAARAIVAAVDHRRIADVPDASQSETTIDADAVGRLTTMTLDVLRNAAHGKVLWLVIDDLDRHPIDSRWTTASYLDAVYRAVTLEERLRIVLIGPTAELPSVSGLPTTGTDTLNGHVSNSDVQSWVEALSGTVMAQDVAEKIVRIARSMAQSSADDPEIGPTAAIAEVLNKHIGPVLRPDGEPEP